MTDLIITKLKAHRKFMSSRILNVEKWEAFDRSLERMIVLLEDEVGFKSLLLNKNFESIRNYFYLQKDENYHKGVYMAIDLYSEICYNIVNRFETGYSTNEVFIKL